jgi:4-diphosphocytidyl-2-C-methyl-D-erythritol kinase
MARWPRLLIVWARARARVVCRMNLRQNESPWTVPAPAKLNLFLEVLGRRPDGYHELQTLMAPVRLYDTLIFSTTRLADDDSQGAISLDVSVQPPCSAGAAQAASIPTGAENLVVRALELLRNRSGCSQGARIQLIKRIPVAAGLGGGSSDAAAALRLGNRGWGIRWSHEQLATLAAELGSDVPFFLTSGPAICRGRGEQIERISGSVPLHCVIVKPETGLSTSGVYSVWDSLQTGGGVERQTGRLAELTSALRQGDLNNLGKWMGNGLQVAAALLSPWVDRARAAFAQLDFLGHQLTGSGSAYFGICRHAQHARRLASILRTRQLGSVFVTQSCR